MLKLISLAFYSLFFVTCALKVALATKSVILGILVSISVAFELSPPLVTKLLIIDISFSISVVVSVFLTIKLVFGIFFKHLSFLKDL